VRRERDRIRTPEYVQQYAHELRQKLTPAESLLWRSLRGRQLNGLKFRRQHPLGPFIADFYCAEHHLIVEIDGGIHDLQAERDAFRMERMEAYGYHVIRFRNERVLHDLSGVLEAIGSVCRELGESGTKPKE